MNFDKPFLGFVIFIATIHFLTATPIKPIREIFVSTEELIENRQGIISTFDLNITSNNVKVVWNFKFPEAVILKLRAKRTDFYFQLNHTCPRCCPENTLYVPDDYLQQHEYCANNMFESSVASGKNFTVTFTSKYYLQGIELEYFVQKRTNFCSKLSFECLDQNGCYNIKEICDGEFDCEDHTDEQNCGQCRTNYTMCNHEDYMEIEHKNCFNPELHRCDGILHCRTGEDEFNCVDECKNQLQCEDRSGCYKLFERCDGIFNCKDRSDEVNCYSIKCEVLSNLSDYFFCTNGWCIEKFKVLDGTKDCDDGSDETVFTKGAKDSFGLIICMYVLLILALLWIAFLHCSQVYRMCQKDNLKESATQKDRPSAVHSFKRNASSQISGPISSSQNNRYAEPVSPSIYSTKSLFYEIINYSKESYHSSTTEDAITQQSLTIKPYQNLINPLAPGNCLRSRENFTTDSENIYEPIDDPSRPSGSTLLHRSNSVEIWI